MAAAATFLSSADTCQFAQQAHSALHSALPLSGQNDTNLNSGTAGVMLVCVNILSSEF